MKWILLKLHNRFNGLNELIATRITGVIGSMWAAYAFMFLALVSLPDAVATQSALVIVAWLAQTFLQLVLLPVILVGQELQGRRTEVKIEETHAATIQQLKMITEMHEQGQETDDDINRIADFLEIDLDEDDDFGR